MAKFKFSYKYLLKYMALFFVCLVFANGNINGISPFLFAFFFACIYAGVDEKLVAVFTLVSAVVVDLSLSGFYSALTVVAVGLVMYYFHKLIKKRMKFWVVALCYLRLARFGWRLRVCIAWFGLLFLLCCGYAKLLRT